jgi:Ca2+-binding RTX toxin-like protein
LGYFKDGEIETIAPGVGFIIFNSYYNNIENAYGGTQDDRIIGNDENNLLDGGAGNDRLYGWVGNDTLNGGAGNDYLIGGGVTEGRNYVGSGNDILNGGAGDDHLIAHDGNDVLNGGSGYDELNGGLGNDTYIIDADADADVDFESDTIDEKIYLGENYVSSNVGIDTLDFRTTTTTDININLGATNTQKVADGVSLIIPLAGTIENAYGGKLNDTIIGSDLNNVLYGEAGDDQIDGGDGKDHLDGGADYDTLNGGEDNDLLYGQSGNDTLNGGEGNDFLYGGADYDTLNGDAGNDFLYGDAGNDTLNGGDGNDQLVGDAGNDKMVGGKGDDDYYVDNAGDTVSETANQGTDIVYSTIGYTLGANVENLTLEGIGSINGTGNTLNNTITGNSGNNIIRGGVGNDTLRGGTGNDTYLIDADVDTGRDTINDTKIAGGVDALDFRTTTTKAITINLGNTSTQDVATGLRLTITDLNIENAYGGTKNDILTGNSLNNTLIGGAGNDTLTGAAGNDTYSIDADVDLGTDTIKEIATTGGIDSIDFSTTTTKAININLGLTTTQTVATGVQLAILFISIENVSGGILNDTLSGNSLNNVLRGGAGNDTLKGLVGNDTLYGGAGYDKFYFDGAALTGAMTVAKLLGKDTIADFTKTQDKIVLSKATFSKMTSANGAILNFATAADDTAAGKLSAAIVYNTTTGNLFYNSDGVTAGFGANGGNFATVTARPLLAASDFSVV